MLLFAVRVQIAPEKLPEFNNWHIPHMARLASLPGYEAVRRYHAAGDEATCAALYELRDDRLHTLLGADLDARHPNSYVDGPRYDTELLPHVEYFQYSIYRPALGTAGPFLEGDAPIAQLLLSVADDQRPGFADRVAREAIPALVADDRVARATAFEAVHDPHVPALGTVPTPDVLVLMQLASTAPTSFAASPPEVVRELLGGAAVSEGELALYLQTARFWPSPADELHHEDEGRAAKAAILAAIQASA